MYLWIFCSSKNRRIASAPCHSPRILSPGSGQGEYKEKSSMKYIPHTFVVFMCLYFENF